MKQVVVNLAFVTVCAVVALAQKGVAEPGHYQSKSKKDATGVKVKFNEVFTIRFLPKEN